MEEFLKNIQVEATLYGMTLNLTKTELLQGKEYTAPVYFIDGTEVTQVEKSKYLGTQVSWQTPSKTDA